MIKNISVIIPTFNRDVSTVQKAIDSVLKQDQSVTVEIILSDNAGTFPVQEISSSEKIIYVDSSEKPGVSFARNKGAHLAKYDHIAFLDDDDMWTKDFLLKMLKEIENKKSDMTICGFLNHGGNIESQKIPPESITIQTLLERNPGFTGSTFIIKKGIFKKLRGFNEDLYTSNDKDFFIRFLLERNTYSVVPEALVQRDDSIHSRLTQVSERKILSTEKFFNIYKGNMNKKTISEYSFKIDMLKTLHVKSFISACVLFYRYPKKIRTNLSVLRHLILKKEIKI